MQAKPQTLDFRLGHMLMCILLGADSNQYFVEIFGWTKETTSYRARRLRQLGLIDIVDRQDSTKKGRGQKLKTKYTPTKKGKNILVLTV